MRSLSELLSDDPAWPEVVGWIGEARRPVEVVGRDRTRSEATLHALQVTTGSPMGAIAYETGGLAVESGWLRILGGGGDRLDGLAPWNGLGEPPHHARLDGGMIVAHDAVGGFFALDGGAFGAGDGSAHYRSPDELSWEPTGMSYSDLVWWALTGDLSGFYAGLRWPGWEQETAALELDQGFSLYPPPFTQEGRPVERASRRPVPMAELWGFYTEAAQGS
jgi:hypothetical protein